MTDITQYILKISIIVCFCTAVGILAGCGSVFVFNKIPEMWLMTNRTPEKTPDSLEQQRLKSYPWKWLLSAFFINTSIYVSLYSIKLAVAVVCVVWILTAIAAADIIYKYIPDFLIMLLAATAAGCVPFHDTVRTIIAGAGVFGGSMYILLLIRKFVSKGDPMWDEVKFGIISGMTIGLKGSLIVMPFAITSALIAAAVKIKREKARTAMTGTEKKRRYFQKKEGNNKEYRTFGHYIAIWSIIYMVLLFGRQSIIIV